MKSVINGLFIVRKESKINGWNFLMRQINGETRTSPTSNGVNYRDIGIVCTL